MVATNVSLLVLKEQKADSQGDKGVDHDRRVVKRPDALRFWYAIFFNNDKIQPGAGEFMRAGAVEQVQQQAEQQEDAQEDDGFAPAKQGIIAAQHPQHDEDFAKLVPFGLQGVRADEAGVILDLFEQFGHVNLQGRGELRGR
jgi:hypothetical protein